MRVVQVLFLALLLCLSPSASAGKVGFGDAETLYYAAPVELKAPDGQDLYLARKYTISYLGFAYTWRDDGYVLARSRDRNTYYPLPVDAKLQKLQASGQLPNPLPVWEQSVVYSVFEGHSLWYMLGAMFLAVSYALFRLHREVRQA